MASRHFSDKELSCKCGCGGITNNQALLKGLDRLREAIGAPLYLSCAYRCPQHNARVGGVANSQHVKGTAADVLCPSHLTMGQFAWYVDKYSGADGIGVYNSSEFIHIDYRDNGNSPSEYYWEG